MPPPKSPAQRTLSSAFRAGSGAGSSATSSANDYVAEGHYRWCWSWDDEQMYTNEGFAIHTSYVSQWSDTVWYMKRLDPKNPQHILRFMHMAYRWFRWLSCLHLQFTDKYLYATWSNMASSQLALISSTVFCCAHHQHRHHHHQSNPNPSLSMPVLNFTTISWGL